MSSPSPSPLRPGFMTADSLSVFNHSSSFGELRRGSGTGSDSPYSFAFSARYSTLSEKVCYSSANVSLRLPHLSEYSLSPDPRSWGSNLSPDFIEPDDSLHNPENPFHADGRRFKFSARGVANLGCLAMLCAVFLVVFIGYPIGMYATSKWPASPGFNIGGINSTGQVPSMGNFGLIDLDTPKDAFVRKSFRDGEDWILVFSDEFNTDGRSFYPGDDPYWEAADLHYWATNNLEWYDPAAVTTANGSLVITFSETPSHDLDFQGGLISSWNKFCFTGGLFEAAVQLPGTSNVVGMWPAIWTMGNLGRAGYGATLEGMWPYTYDTCDVGTAPNQTINGLPVAATINGDHLYNDVLSYLPGQRLSRCTCDGEDHPGPKHSDGSYVGRSAPEIDVFEAQMGGSPLSGEVSQSAQWAPFDEAYLWDNSTANMVVTNPSMSRINGFVGNVVQEATSVVTKTNQRCYELIEPCYSVYAFEYKPGYDDAYITWVSDSQTSWTLNAGGVGANAAVEISARPVPQEPMYMIINLGMSKNFGTVDFEHLTFPNHLRVDYVRVYQPMNKVNIGCNPPGYPTQNYIDAHLEAYSNPNLTTWRVDYGKSFPKNKLLEVC